jgi:CHAT domain-containing protein/Tfp pilus assembly protein PilF
MRLELGQTVVREIVASEVHSYQISVKESQFIYIAIDERGASLRVALFDPAGNKLLEADGGGSVGERVSVSYIALSTGLYRVDVRPAEAGAPQGRYEIRLQEQRRAAAKDDNRIAAQNEFARGVALYSARGPDSYRQAIERFKAALSLYRDLGMTFEEAVTLNRLGQAYRVLREANTAIEYQNQALAIYRRLGDRYGEGPTLNAMGNTCSALNNNDEAVKYYELALAVRRDLKDRIGEGSTLGNLGRAYGLLSQYDKAIGYFEQALAIHREVRDRAAEGGTLGNLGVTCGLLSQYDRAIGYFEQALAIHREVKDRAGEAWTLENLGNGSDFLGQHERAIGYYEQALVINREVKARGSEGRTLRHIGDAYRSMSQYEKSIRYYEQALAINREVKDRRSEGGTLSGLGSGYLALGQHQKALSYYEQVLAIFREVKNRNDEGMALDNLGNAYSLLGEYEKAIGYYEQAMAIEREVKDRNSEGRALGNLGNSYDSLGKYDKAIGYHEQALVILREVKDRAGEGRALGNLGNSYYSLGKYDEATAYYEQALVILRETKDRDGEGRTLHNLMNLWDKVGRPRVAIVYGKQAVNAAQEIRGNINGLDRSLQQGLLKSREGLYQKLASLLISQGRLPEAQRVIELLKEKEFSDFVRGKGDNLSAAGEKVEMTEDEKRFQEISDRVIELGAERGALFAKGSRTPDEQTRLLQLEGDMRVVRAAYQKLLDELSARLGNTSEAGEKLANLKAAQSLQKTLRDLGPGAVVLYTVVSDDKYQVILVTPDAYKAEEYPIKSDDLRSKIFEFRKVLQDPRLDPVPLARELYDIVFCKSKLRRDLDKARATILMWSLDDALRYVPMAALHDGKSYMVERYKSALFTLASRDSLKEVPTASWRAAGLGVSKPHEGFQGLPGVSAELRGIIRGDDDPGGKGVLPGTVKLDEAFDEQALESALLGHYPVVHIASHFVFRPGNETNSFLLMGRGELDLEHLKKYSFEGIEILTLSACDTATGRADAKGKEVESFGMLAQARGAEAVMATLWPVYDDSTRQLMQEFYRRRQAESGTSKGEALRLAQLGLLRGGKQAAPADDANRGPKSIDHRNQQDATKSAPFKRNPEAPFAHPYYWAPFILIGNWR